MTKGFESFWNVNIFKCLVMKEGSVNPRCKVRKVQLFPSSVNNEKTYEDLGFTQVHKSMSNEYVF